MGEKKLFIHRTNLQRRASQEKRARVLSYVFSGILLLVLLSTLFAGTAQKQPVFYLFYLLFLLLAWQGINRNERDCLLLDDQKKLVIVKTWLFFHCRRREVPVSQIVALEIRRARRKENLPNASSYIFALDSNNKKLFSIFNSRTNREALEHLTGLSCREKGRSQALSR